MEYNALEFDLIKEEWNKYEIDDGSILAAKFVLERLVHFTDEEGKEGLIPHGKPAFSVWFTPDHLRKKGLEEDDQIEGEKALFIDFNQLAEPWNKYSIAFNGQTHQLKLKLLVVGISKYVDKYDKYGYPRYLINHSLSFTIQKLE